MINTLSDFLDADSLPADRSITYITGGKNEHSVSFTELRERAYGILHHLQTAGLTPGDELVIFTNDNEQFVDIFWACLLGGIVPVPVAVGISDDHRFKLINIHASLKSAHLITARGLASRLEEFAGAHGLQSQVQEMLDSAIYVDYIEDISQPGERYAATGDDVAFIQFSSGSTSTPKGVVLTHENVVTNIHAIIDAAGFSPADTALSWMPLTHDMGLIGFHLSMLAAGTEHYIMDTSLFVRRPLLWLQKISEKGVTLACSPNFGYKHALKVFESRGLENCDLSTLRVVFNGAEPISVDLGKKFMHDMTPLGLDPEIMLCVYGLAEASLAVTFPPLGSSIESVTVHRHQLAVGQPFVTADQSDPDAVTFARVGVPIKDCEVRICDDGDNPLAETLVGHVQIRGGNVTKGYYSSEIPTEEVFAKGDWLRTGDLGFFIEGQLVITGRSKDIIFVNGQNYYPHDLEELVHELDQLELGKVVVGGTTGPESGDDKILVFVLHRGGLEDLLPLARKVRGHINSQTGLEVHEVIPVQRIPKTTSGKIQRARLVNDYLDDAFAQEIAGLAALGQTGEAEEAGTNLEQVLLSICNQVVIDTTVQVDDNLFEIGISSLALAQIHELIEEAYPGKMDIADVFEYPSVGELAQFLQSRIDAPPEG